MGNVAVITAVLGGMDEPKPFPEQDFNGYDRFIVTGSSHGPARVRARYFKLQSHKIFSGYDAFIWIDGNIQIKTAQFIAEMIEALEDNDIAISRHPERGCIYEEARFIAQGIETGSAYLCARYDHREILDQAEAYSQSFPANAGLYWCGIFARKASVKTNIFFDGWWAECHHWPRSIDQVPFPYLAQKMGLSIAVISWGAFNDNPTYRRVPHLKVQ